MTPVLLRFVPLLALFLPVAAFAAAPLAVSEAWMREPPPAASATAAYATLRNTGSQPLTLTGARSTLGRVELHETRVENGVARMRPIPSLTLPPGGTLELAPGGLHLMLLDPKPAPKAGERVPLWLQTREAGEVQAEFTVRPSTGSTDSHEHHHHGSTDSHEHHHH